MQQRLPSEPAGAADGKTTTEPKADEKVSTAAAGAASSSAPDRKAIKALVREMHSALDKPETVLQCAKTFAEWIRRERTSRLCAAPW